MYRIKQPRVAPWIVGVCLFIITASVAMCIFWFIDFRNTVSKAPSPQPITPSKTALVCTEALPTDFKIGQKLMAAGYSEILTEQTTPFVTAKLGGVIIMNETSAESISQLKAAFSTTPFIAVDQEGGTVQRYTSQGLLPGATDMAANNTPEQAYALYRRDADTLKATGITTNLAPVADVITTVPSPLPGRMYSDDPTVVTTYASEAVQAYQDAGLTPVLKHFPGLGTTSISTDFGTATTAPLAQLETKDVLTFKNLAKFNTDIMMSNAIVPNLTNGQPAVWSPAAVNLLRGYGYQNAVLYSDSLTAEAIPGTLEDAALKAWQAGIDVALVVQSRGDAAQLQTTLSTIIDKATAALEAGQLSNDEVSASVVRILARKGIDPCSLPTNPNLSQPNS